MRYLLLTTLLFLASTVSAQTVYQAFEVETEAQPIGGPAMLEQFISVNRRMPYSAEVAKIKGSVIVTGVIEPNGRISEVKASRGLHPACDREAVRVLGLFNAWRPARKGGQAVRQQFSYRVTFAPTRPGSEPGQVVTYYGKEAAPTTDSTLAFYKKVEPVDSSGVTIAAPVVFKRNGSEWVKDWEYGFEKTASLEENIHNPYFSDSVKIVRHQVFDYEKKLQGVQYSFYEDGRLYARGEYENDKPIGPFYYYAPNGMVSSIISYLDSGRVSRVIWYPNGLAYMNAIFEPAPTLSVPTQVRSLWDSSGRQTVINGNGIARLWLREEPHGWILQMGQFRDGLRDSVWTGQVGHTGRLLYRDEYQNKAFVRGESFDENGIRLSYQKLFEQPEFQGGLKGLSTFLANNLHYPRNASRQGIQGKVFISFVVNTDGSIANIKVFRNVHPELDAEAYRVVKATSRKWKPGIMRGKPVRVKFNLPINFALN